MASQLRGLVLSSGGRRWYLNQRPLMMGIINLTPDSFSDGGCFSSPAAAYHRAQALIAAGADILDLGAESTRPGAKPVSILEEKRRLLSALKRITRLGTPISVDTCKPEVAAAALQAGASIINDVTGLRDHRMRQLAAEQKVPVVVMHMRGTPRSMQRAPRYQNVVQEVLQTLLQVARQAETAGIKPQRIILDPGIGFGKTAQHNLLLLRALPQLVATGYPILVGPSRKSFITSILGPLPPSQRIWGTAAAVAQAVLSGVQILRVHDVAEMHMVSQVAFAIRQGKIPRKQGS